MNMRYSFLLFCLLLVSWQDNPRQLWAVLGRVKFHSNPSDVLTMNMTPPTYSAEVKALEGKEITIEGYVIPMDFGGQYFVISSNPFASCFFCGGAGPETVMEVYLKSNRKVKAEKVVVKGRLQLNRGNLDHLTYMLKEAIILKEE